MPKTAIKAFVYSFSVSLFAMMTANRILAHNQPSEAEPLVIDSKNIVLFLKNVDPAYVPVRKIALSNLPAIEKKAVPAPLPQPEIILADSFEDIDFPLEFVADAPSEQSPPSVTEAPQPVVLADVLYAPDKPLEEPEIDAEVVYTPEQPVQIALKAPVLQPEAQVSTPKEAPAAEQPDDQALVLARAQTLENIPLQQTRDPAAGRKKITIGNPAQLNHIAMNDASLPIASMEKQAAKPQDAAEPAKPQEWTAMSDSPWLVARAGAGGKNKLAKQEFTNKSEQEIKAALATGKERQGVRLASETVKNLIIPIPGEIMEKDNLTPKLAYPSTSEDAEKEREIDAEIKKKTRTATDDPAAVQQKQLLSPLEEDVALDIDLPEVLPPPAVSEAGKTDPAAKTAKAEAKSEAAPKEEGGIINKLNSIFSKSAKSIDEAKEKAIAKAQAKRSLKKRQVKAQPAAIIPAEIRLSFQPNRAEISGQTLRWVQAFATKAAESPNLSLEIRIDGASPTALQQKRLNLLHNILTNKGVEYSKINTVFTTREPNSFILRTIRHDNTTGETTRKANISSGTNYIQW